MGCSERRPGPLGGKRGSGEVLKAIHGADVILALGSRLSQDTTGWDYSFMNAASRIIQVNIDDQEIGRNYPVEASPARQRAYGLTTPWGFYV